MDLIACAAPCGRLEPAPETGLRRSSAVERWDGFWVDDSYYVRCTPLDGTVRWYRQDEGQEETAAESVPTTPFSVAWHSIGAAASAVRTRGILVRVCGAKGPFALVGVRRRRAR